MASHPRVAFQTAQAALLKASTALTAAGCTDVVDELSARGSVYPYVEIGDDQVLGDNDQFAQGPAGRSEIWSNVHIWAAGPGARIATEAIGDVVRDLLSVVFAVDGHVMLSALFFKSVPMTQSDPSDPDGVLAHLVMTFKYQTRPAPAA